MYTIQFSRLGTHLCVLFNLCVHVCTVWVWCIGSGFPFFSSSMTNLASVLCTCIFMYVCRHMIKPKQGYIAGCMYLILPQRIQCSYEMLRQKFGGGVSIVSRIPGYLEEALETQPMPKSSLRNTPSEHLSYIPLACSLSSPAH